MISYSRQAIDKKDINSVQKVLKSNFLTQGPVVPKFEKKISKFVKSKYAVAVNSATSGLHIACLSLGLKKGEILWTTPNSFVASSNCALYCGAKVDFVDINLDDFNICHKKLEIKLKTAKKKNELPKILVVVHFAGNPCNLKYIKNLSKKYKFKILEDASHALGSKYDNKKIGNCQYSNATIFSFHPVKPITTAEGGMVTTNDKKTFEKLILFRNHGITRNVKKFKNKEKNSWNYEQLELGYNYRMNDLEAALGISQLSKLNNFNKIRNKVANIYNTNFKNLSLKTQKIDKNNFSSYHLFVIYITSNKKNIRKKLFEYFRKNKILVNIHYIPIHSQPYYKKLGFKIGQFENSETYYKKALSLPIHPLLKIRDIKKIIKIVKKYLKN